MNWEIIQCCEPGKKHETSVCQDNCFKLEDAHYRVMALCDGTSDAEFSDLGSKWVAEFTARYFKEHFDSMYNTSFAKLCEVLTQYHQQLLMHLSECATKETGISIVVNRKINNQELRKYCTTVQVVAVKEGKAVYFKVGNGAAILINKHGPAILSDSSTESPTTHVTMPNTLSVLGCCDFQYFELNDDNDYDIILMTDGVEFSQGLFYNHEIRSDFERLRDLTQSILFTEADLRTFILEIKDSLYNTAQDDIGISILHNVRNQACPFVGKEVSESTATGPLVVNSVLNEKISKKTDMDITAERIQVPDIGFLNKKDVDCNQVVNQKTPVAESSKKRVDKQLKNNVAEEQQFYKKIMIHLLIAFIVGTFLGGISNSFKNSRKIDNVNEEINRLSEKLDSLNDSIDELKSNEPKKDETPHSKENEKETHNAIIPAES